MLGDLSSVDSGWGWGEKAVHHPTEIEDWVDESEAVARENNISALVTWLSLPDYGSS